MCEPKRAPGNLVMTALMLGAVLLGCTALASAVLTGVYALAAVEFAAAWVMAAVLVRKCRSRPRVAVHRPLQLSLRQVREAQAALPAPPKAISAPARATVLASHYERQGVR